MIERVLFCLFNHHNLQGKLKESESNIYSTTIIERRVFQLTAEGRKLIFVVKSEPRVVCLLRVENTIHKLRIIDPIASKIPKSR